jgi:hypothetical protein
MCYGDIDYGRDGYYRQEVELEERERAQNELDEENYFTEIGERE